MKERIRTTALPVLFNSESSHVLVQVMGLPRFCWLALSGWTVKETLLPVVGVKTVQGLITALTALTRNPPTAYVVKDGPSLCTKAKAASASASALAIATGSATGAARAVPAVRARRLSETFIVVDAACKISHDVKRTREV